MLDAVTTLPAGMQIALAMLLGLLIGSFLNVVIHRLPKMMERQWLAECTSLQGGVAAEQPRYNLFYPPSACVHCQAPIRAWQNIPVLSFLLQRGRCASCGGAIAWRYPLVELASGLLLAGLAWRWGLGGYWLWASGFALTLLVLAAIDAATQLLPDDLTYPLLWAGLLFNLDNGHVPLEQAVLGAVIGYLVLWGVYWLFKLATGKEGMGYGDFKLLAALGAWLGWQMIPLIILLSSLVGAIVGIALLARGKQGSAQPMPFGPYLAAAGLIAFLWGKPIVAWYLGA